MKKLISLSLVIGLLTLGALCPTNNAYAASKKKTYLYALCKDKTASRSKLGAKNYRGMCSRHKGIKKKLGSKKPAKSKYTRMINLK